MSDAADTDSPSSPSSPSSSTTTSAGDGDAPPVNDHKAYLTQKRTEFLNHMLRSIDIITYLHLTYLYLLDCSFIRFALRSSTQFLFLTPKILTFPLPPHQRSPIIALLGSTAFCVLEHLWEANPAAGELTHGYQHGGLIVDFIGQEGPISKWRLLYVDAAVLLLQLMMLSLVISKQGLSPPPPATTDQEEGGAHERTLQDLETEERGEVGIQPLPLLSDTLHDSHTDDGGELENGELERMVFAVTAGEFEVAKMDVVGVVRRQWGQAGTTIRVEQSTGPPARFERRGGRWRFTFNGQTRSWN